MSVSDPIADMLTKIRNASRAGLGKVEIGFSRVKLGIIKVLTEEGFVHSFKQDTVEGREIITVLLRYDKKSNPVIHGIKSVSTPGRRVYSGYRKMRKVFNGLGTMVVSTSSGVTTGNNAVTEKVGGELLCEVW